MADLYTLYQYMDLFMVLIVVVSLWSLIWKGFALWRAGQRKSVAWFIVILILNTAGILPILYLIFTKNPNKKPKQKKASASASVETKKTSSKKKSSKKKAK